MFSRSIGMAALTCWVAAPAAHADDGPTDTPSAIIVAVPQETPNPGGGTQVIVLPPPPPIVIMSPPPPPVVVPPPPPPFVAPAPVAPYGGITELNFVSNDDEEYVISVYNESPGVEDYQPQCRTPCVLQVPNGTYEFMAGNHRTFSVYALGGVQYWRVEDNSLGGIIAGAIMTGIGGIIGGSCGLVLGVVSEASGGQDFTDLEVVTGLGLGTGVLGLVIWLMSYGVSEEYQPTDGYIPVGNNVGVLPTLIAGRDASGADAWGLGLALRF